MSETEPQPAVETIADAAVWEAITDGVNAIASKEEAAFVFTPDGLSVGVKDTANVALINMECDPGAFGHYEADGETTIGVDTGKLADVLSAASGDDVVKFDLDGKTRKFDFESNGVEYELAGIDPESMRDSPVDVPGLKDDYTWSIRCNLPVGKWSTGIDVVDLSGSGHGTFTFDGDRLTLDGDGDTDRSRVDLTDHDGFAWRDGEPDAPVECVMSNDYMSDIISVVEDGDEDTVRFATGDELPFHVWQTHADGRIDTKIVQAPRIVKN